MKYNTDNFEHLKHLSNLDYDQSIIPPSKFRTSQENNGMNFYKFNNGIKLAEVNIFKQIYYFQI